MTGSYEEAGVSLARGDAASEDAKRQIQLSHNGSVISELGMFGIDLQAVLPNHWKNPILSQTADGVGTKLIYAAVGGQHETVGIDLVAMVVDDHSRYNRRPITFAAYRGTNTISPEIFSLVLKGVVDGCVQAGVPYTAGETAEMPGFYVDPHYEIVGFSVALHERGSLRVGQKTVPGDLLIGLPSNGVGSNGFSLLRKLWPPEKVVAGRCPVTLDQILKPTPIYTKAVLAVNDAVGTIRGWAHITGGGLGERGKLVQLLPSGLAAELDSRSWNVPDIFLEAQKAGDLSDERMRETFNMGLMMIAPVNPQHERMAVHVLEQHGCRPIIVGRVVEQTGDKRVLFV